MKKIKYVLLLLFCGVLTYAGLEVNAKMVAERDKTVHTEKRLKELRKKVKKMFPDTIKYSKIGPKYFEKSKDESVFTMRFSNIIYGTLRSDNIVKIPIFRGTMGDVLYDDFLEYCEAKGLLKGHTEAAFKVNFNKGEFGNVLDEFKKFYGSSLSIDFSADPAKWTPYSEEEGIMMYKFSLDGVEGELSYYYPHKKYEKDATKLEYVIFIY